MKYSTIKVNPFEQVNEDERIDKEFFQRMQRFENYYQNLAKGDTQFTSNYQIIKHINKLINEDLMSQKDVWNVIQYFNENSDKYCHNGSVWLETRLHLRHLAFVYGLRMKLNNELKLTNE